MICLVFKEVRNVFVDSSFRGIVHGFEGFWRDAVETGCFPFFEFGDGTFDFAEGNRGIGVSKAWPLRNEIEDGAVDGSVVVEDFTEVHAEDRHVFFCVGGKVTIVELHGHVDAGFVVCGFAAGKQVDVFPCEAWVESHVVYVGTYPAIPACFGQIYEVTIALADLFEFELEVGKFVIGEIMFVV